MWVWSFLLKCSSGRWKLSNQTFTELIHTCIFLWGITKVEKLRTNHLLLAHNFQLHALTHSHSHTHTMSQGGAPSSKHLRETGVIHLINVKQNEAISWKQFPRCSSVFCTDDWADFQPSIDHEAPVLGQGTQCPQIADIWTQNHRKNLTFPPRLLSRPGPLLC